MSTMRLPNIIKRRKPSDHKKLSEIITGERVPKSLGLIELEKKYDLVAQITDAILDKMETMNKKMELLEKKISYSNSGPAKTKRKF